MPGPKTGKGRKAKGATFERDIMKMLREEGIDCSRNAMTGTNFDLGDILGVKDWTIQCKAYSNVTEGLKLGIEGAKVQQERGKTRWMIAIVKRPRASVAEAYCAMTLTQFIKLLRYIRSLEKIVGDHIDNKIS